MIVSHLGHIKIYFNLQQFLGIRRNIRGVGVASQVVAFPASDRPGIEYSTHPMDRVLRRGIVQVQLLSGRARQHFYGIYLVHSRRPRKKTTLDCLFLNLAERFYRKFSPKVVLVTRLPARKLEALGRKVL